MTDDVRAKLEAQMKNRMEAADTPPAGAAPGFRARASRVEVGCLLRSFAILVRADYPLPRALEMLGRSTSNPDLAQTVRSVGGRVEAGTPLSTALAAYPWYFDRVACSTVLAAEQTAQLGQALSFLADDIDEEIEVRDRAGQALAYPAIVLSASALVVLGVLYFAVPMFHGLPAGRGHRAQRARGPGLRPVRPRAFPPRAGGDRGGRGGRRALLPLLASA